MNLTKIINEKYHLLTSTEKSAIHYVLNNTEEIESMSIFDLAKESHTSEASIVRMCKKLGFKGYAEFKYFLSSGQNQREETLDSTSSLNDLEKDMLSTVKIFKHSDQAKLTQMMCEAERIFLFGTGWGENRAMESFYRNMLSLHVHPVIIPSITELNWNVDNVDERDLMFVASYTGSTPDLLPILKKIKLKGVKIISVTPFHTNYISQISDLNLYYDFTPLEIDNKKYKEFNFFLSLEILMELVYRSYYDKINTYRKFSKVTKKKE